MKINFYTKQPTHPRCNLYLWGTSPCPPERKQLFPNFLLKGFFKRLLFPAGQTIYFSVTWLNLSKWKREKGKELSKQAQMLWSKPGKVNSHEFWTLHRTWHPVRAPSQCFESSPRCMELPKLQSGVVQGRLGAKLTKLRLPQGRLKC